MDWRDELRKNMTGTMADLPTGDTSLDESAPMRPTMVERLQSRIEELERDEPAPHLYRQRVARRYDAAYEGAHQDDDGRQFLQAYYGHARAEALAEAMVDLLSDLPQRETWRTKADYHNRSCQNIAKMIESLP